MALPNGVFMTTMPRPDGGGNIDIVDADAGPANDLEPRGGGDDLRRHLAGRTDGEAIIVRDCRQQRILVLAKIGLVVDIDATVAEDLNGGFGKLVGNENAGCHRLLLESGLNGNQAETCA